MLNGTPGALVRAMPASQAIFRIDMVEAYGGGSNEADSTAFQQFQGPAGAGTYDQRIGFFYSSRE
jgi:hypothetical protein